MPVLFNVNDSPSLISPLFPPSTIVPTLPPLPILYNFVSKLFKERSPWDWTIFLLSAFFLESPHPQPPMDQEGRTAATKIGLVASVIVGASCIICPPLGATLVTTYSAAALGCTAVSTFSKNEDVKAVTEGIAIASATAASGGIVGQFKKR